MENLDWTQLGIGGAIVMALYLLPPIIRALRNGKTGDSTAASLAVLATKIEGLEGTIARLDTDFRVQFRKYDEVRLDVTKLQVKMETCQTGKEN